MTFELFGQEFGMLYIVSQVFALVAMMLSLYAFQKKEKMKILNFTIVSATCSTLHYLFLGAWPGVMAKAISVVRNAFAAYETHNRRVAKLVPFVFVFLYVMMGFLTYQSPISLLPVLAAVICTLAIYFVDAKKLRYVAALTSGMWLIYGVLVFSIMGVVAEAVFIVNDLVTIYRYRKKPRRKKR